MEFDKKIENLIKKEGSNIIKQSDFEEFISDFNLSEEDYQNFIDELLKKDIFIEENIEEEVAEEHLEADFEEEDRILGNYFSEISKYEILSKEEEIKLFLEYKNGIKEAKEKLITSNLKLVAKLALKYVKSGVSYLDLIQDGAIGLINGIEKFDITKGYRLSTYVSWWIRKEILDSLKLKVNYIKVPKQIQLLYQKILKAEKEISNKKSKRASDEEIAEYLSMSIDEIFQIRSFVNSALSMSDISENDYFDIKDNETEEKINREIEEVDNKYKINKLLKKLTLTERKIIEMYYGIGEERKTILDISNSLNISKDKINILKKRAIQKLKYSGKGMWKEE